MKNPILFVLAILLSCKVYAQVTPYDLKCEYRTNPLGIDNIKPRLSWKIQEAAKTRGQKQTAYQLLVASSIENLAKNIGNLWDSKKVSSNQSVNNAYDGAKLESGQQCYWKVRVWDKNGKVSKWSGQAHFSVGLLSPEDWTGEWILKENQVKTDHNWYRKNFELKDIPETAMVYLASFGYHELYVNGKKIGDGVMNPVSSFMKTRIPYLCYDIKDLLVKGDNVIAVWHAAGWARWNRVTEYQNPPFVFKAQVQIQAKDKKLILASDTSWKCKKSNSEYYGDWDILDFGGETVNDMRKEDDWNTIAYNDNNWENASIYNPEKLNAKIVGDNISINLNSRKKRTFRREYTEIKAVLSAQMVEPQVKYKEITPIGVTAKQDGTYIVDMGENYTGYYRMELYKGKAGDSVLFEISDQQGQASSWKQKSKYIYGKSGSGTFTNRFNVAGGRWVTIYGLDYKPELKDIKGFVVTNNRKRISKFESSSELLNNIYEVNLATYLANTMDGILVDCPHRERRGWGEVTVAAMYGDAFPNFESGAYMDQYSQYMRDAQFKDGRTRAVINEQDRQFLMWKANNPITIWETYYMIGDKKMLQDNYASMHKWMEWLYNNSDYENGGALKTGKRGTREFPGLGDWCTPKGNFWSSSNSPEAIHFNNCLYAYMLDCAIKISGALGKANDVKTYTDRLKVQRRATHELFYNPRTGLYGNGQQVNQAFALIAGIVPESEIDKVYKNLVDVILYGFPYYDTGSSGQALYTRFFTEYAERMDLIYELLRDTRHPSYGYFLRQGKTVWPERWSAVGNSQIHTCYTGIGGYFIKGFGGIRPNQDSPGMQKIIIKPAPVGDLTFANTEHESMYGKVKVDWKRTTSTSEYNIEIPVNSTATLYIPAVNKTNIKEGEVPAEKAQGVSYIGTEPSDAVGNYIVYEVESGNYSFTVNNMPETQFPEPMYNGDNLSKIGRINASSMYIVNEKNPGFEAFKVNDELDSTSWKAAKTGEQWIEVEWVKPQVFSEVVIDEVKTNITKHKVQYWSGNTWVDLASGNQCGKGKSYTFKPVKSLKCRVFIEQATDLATISELKVLR